MAWIYLVLAGIFEIAWAIGLKFSAGFTRLDASLATLGCMAVSVVLLSIAAKELPIGTAYAVWTGIGAAGTAVLGMLLLGEPAGILRIACLGLIIAGIVGLKLLTGAA